MKRCRTLSAASTRRALLPSGIEGGLVGGGVAQLLNRNGAGRRHCYGDE
ncbi:hypothetical protein [Streptomyces sp. NPDC058249]